MWKALRLGILTAAVLAAAAPAWKPAGAAQTQFLDAGGSVSLDAGDNLVLTDASLSNPAGLLSLTCPLTSIPPTSPFALEWSCSGGSFTLQSTDGSTGVSGTFRSGTFNLEKYGGGIGGNIRYLIRL